MTRYHVGLLWLGAGALLATRSFLVPLFAHPSTSSGWPDPSTPLRVTPSLSRGERVDGQEQAPNRPEFTLVAKDFRYSPDRIEVTQDDLVKVTIRSEDIAYSFTVDEYRIVRRVPAGGSTTFEFRADRPGTFRFYSNLTSESGHNEMEGRLVVRPK